MAAALRASPTAKTAKSAEPEGRIDPAPRPMGGILFEVINGRPDMKYVGVFKGDERAWGDHASQGYETVKVTADGPRIKFARTQKLGEELEWQSNIVMAIPLAQWQANFDQAQRFGDAKELSISGAVQAKEVASHDPSVPVVDMADMSDFQ